MEYVHLDFDQRSIWFALRSYRPERHEFGQKLTNGEIKEKVLQNSKLQTLINEVIHVQVPASYINRYQLIWPLMKKMLHH